MKGGFVYGQFCRAGMKYRNKSNSPFDSRRLNQKAANKRDEFNVPLGGSVWCTYRSLILNGNKHLNFEQARLRYHSLVLNSK